MKWVSSFQSAPSPCNTFLSVLKSKRKIKRKKKSNTTKTKEKKKNVENRMPKRLRRFSFCMAEKEINQTLTAHSSFKSDDIFVLSSYEHLFIYFCFMYFFLPSVFFVIRQYWVLCFLGVFSPILFCDVLWLQNWVLTFFIVKIRLINWNALWDCHLVSVYLLKLVFSHFPSETDIFNFFSLTSPISIK